KTYEAIVKGEPIAEPGIPESFKVLVKELQSLGLDIKILTENKQEVSINELSVDDNDTPFMSKEMPEDLKDVSIESFNVAEEKSEVLQEIEKETESGSFDANSLFDDFDDFNE
ncbi:MAG: hypothetical protein RR400_04360, partial [Clostridia bacterium]